MRLLTIITALCLTAQSQAENITFADANVKALCVVNWDLDKDGELSIEEAAAVGSLGNVFREKTNIGSFSELRYFTGLTTINAYAFYKSSIQMVAFPTGVTTIGEYAFSQSNISGELCIPGTVKTISNYAFYSCQRLTGVVLEDGVESVGWHSFSGPIQRLLVPASLKSMNSMAVDPYVNADPSSGIFVPKGDLTVIATSRIPPAINEFAFYYVFAKGHLIVPFGTVDAYKAVPGWSHFGEYLEAGDVNGDGQLNVKDVTSMNAYIMKNNPTPFDERVADLNGDGTINVKDVTLMCSWIMQQGQQQEQ